MATHPDAATLGTLTSGVWTRAAALRHLTGGQVDEFLAAGVWQSPWPGVYSDAGHDLGPLARAAAAVLASGGSLTEPDSPDSTGSTGCATQAGYPARAPRAAVCGLTALRLLDLPLVDDDDRLTGGLDGRLDDVHVRDHLRPLVVPHPEGGPARRLRRHQLTFRDGELVRHPSGLWTTSPARTLLDAARLLPTESLVCALDAALHRGVVGLDELWSMANAHRGERGTPAFRRGLTLSDGRSESPVESLARLVLLPALPGLRPQHVLYDAHGGIVARFDLGDPEVRLAVEADGRRAHAGERMAASDLRRDRATRAHGWQTERVTWWDVRAGQVTMRARVVAEHRRLRALRH